jgi:diguanylate cyclase (GGDEF)-like protein/PAS domain S-box-containing protein
MKVKLLPISLVVLQVLLLSAFAWLLFYALHEATCKPGAATTDGYGAGGSATGCHAFGVVGVLASTALLAGLWYATRLQQRNLRTSEKRFQSLCEQVQHISVQGYDSNHRVIFWNSASEKLYGYSREEAMGRRLEDLIIPSDQRQAVSELIDRWLAENKPVPSGELVLRRKDGAPVNVFSSHTMQYDSRGNAELYCVDVDISQNKQSEQTIWQQANFDALTQLPNRAMFRERLAREIMQSGRNDAKLALLYLDLDNFKAVNDTLGHGTGDLLLQEAARRLLSCVRDTDTVARSGGDEFAVMLADLHDPDRISDVSETILRRMAEPFHLGSQPVYLSSSIGITCFPDDAVDADAMIQNADQAMYAAKDEGRNRCRYFTTAMQKTAQDRMRLTNDLRNALPLEQLELHYQPIVELTSGRIHKAEALLRWRHPVRGVVSPAEFIPVAEDTGLIVGIGDWVFREGARIAARYRATHDPDFQISVNTSAVQYRQGGIDHAAWLAHLQRLGLPGKSMLVEITESVIMDSHSAAPEQLPKFRHAGIQVAIDDFGTGYSSLAYLTLFDLDFLKIDRSFVANLAPGSSSLALCEAIIAMAHRIGLAVVAEGIETQEQRDLLAAAGCDYGQGYLFSRPLDLAAFDAFLSKQRERQSIPA